MKIIINNIANKRDFIDESYGVITLYSDLVKKKKTKIMKLTSICYQRIFLLLIFLLFTIILLNKEENLLYTCLGIIIIGILIITTNLFKIKKMIKGYSNRQAESVLTITEKEITLDNKLDQIIYTENWQNIIQIQISKNCISFIPKPDKNTQKKIIIIPIEYLDELKKIITELQKDYLIIYNNRK